MADIFLSYNREDQPAAEQFRSALEADGLSVWWDQHLRSGETYDEVTENALRTAKAVIVLWTPRSVVSRWVRAEATLADRNGTLLPVMIEECERPIMFELVQTADLMHWDGDRQDPAWLRFVGDVQKFVGVEPAVAATPSEPVRNSEFFVPNKPSLAVMPFADLNRDPEQAYFVDGLMEEIVGALTRIRTLFVIGSGSSLSLKGQDISSTEAAKKLGVRYVLEGSVRKGGDRVRIAVKLIDTATGAQVWHDRFDGGLEDVFELQDEVALGVAGVIDFSVQTAETQRMIHRPTSDLKSYDLYLRAMVEFRKYTPEAMHKALELLEKALELDPDYALAFSMAANCHGLILRFGWSDDPQGHEEQCKQMIGQSLRAGPDDPQVLASIALLFWAIGQFGMAAQLAERSLNLNPGSSLGYLGRGNALLAQGQLDEAEECLERSMKLDPLSPNRNLQLGGLAAVCLAKGLHIEARRFADEANHISMTVATIGLAASARGYLGDYAAAQKDLATLASISPMTHQELAELIYETPENRQLFLDGIAMVENAA